MPETSVCGSGTSPYCIEEEGCGASPSRLEVPTCADHASPSITRQNIKQGAVLEVHLAACLLDHMLAVRTGSKLAAELQGRNQCAL